MPGALFVASLLLVVRPGAPISQKDGYEDIGVAI